MVTGASFGSWAPYWPYVPFTHIIYKFISDIFECVGAEVSKCPNIMHEDVVKLFHLKKRDFLRNRKWFFFCIFYYSRSWKKKIINEIIHNSLLKTDATVCNHSQLGGLWRCQAALPTKAGFIRRSPFDTCSLSRARTAERLTLGPVLQWCGRSRCFP